MIVASIHGRLGGDPVERQTKTGKVMVTASLAVDAARDGSDEQPPIWIDLCSFGKTAEALLRHHKGDLVSAMGVLTRRAYTTRDGTRKEGWSLRVDALVSARSARPSGNRKPAPSSPQATPAENQPFNDPIPPWGAS